MKHTPGPWRVEPETIHDFPRSLKIYGSNGLFVADCGVGSGATSRGEADARLIAAAPRMLEIIKDFVDTADYLASQGELVNSEPLMEARTLLKEVNGTPNNDSSK